MTFGATSNLLRPRGGHEDGRVTFVELFFDLVFVFAITQLSHGLLAHLTPIGALETLILFAAVWIVWISTAWCTNWLDPQRMPVRLMLFVMMLAGLVMSVSIPGAFGDRGVGFGIAIGFMQAGRGAFMLWALHRHSPNNFRNFIRITSWYFVIALVWIAGGFADPQTRHTVWAAAVAIEYLGPAAGYWLPKIGRSTVADWDVEGGHMAERAGLFIIIALGESILVTGATFGEGAITWARVAAFVVAFVGTIAMWWIYFNIGAEKGMAMISHAADPGRLARLAYTYLQLPIGAGIIVCAVADELVLAHPGGHTDFKTAIVVLGGPALYIAGNILFKRTLYGFMPLSHLIGLGALTLLIAAVQILPPLALGAATTLVLVIIAIWETRSLGRSTSVYLK
jgi:low temperature requirement protein LtrA